MIKVYQSYLIKSFWKILVYVTLSFFSLIIILNIFEELTFLKILIFTLVTFSFNLLTSPSIVYETFPFIFFIAHISIFKTDG